MTYSIRRMFAYKKIAWGFKDIYKARARAVEILDNRTLNGNTYELEVLNSNGTSVGIVAYKGGQKYTWFSFHDGKTYWLNWSGYINGEYKK